MLPPVFRVGLVVAYVVWTFIETNEPRKTFSRYLLSGLVTRICVTDIHIGLTIVQTLFVLSRTGATDSNHCRFVGRVVLCSVVELFRVGWLGWGWGVGGGGVVVVVVVGGGGSCVSFIIHCSLNACLICDCSFLQRSMRDLTKYVCEKLSTKCLTISITQFDTCINTTNYNNSQKKFKLLFCGSYFPGALGS